VQASLFAAIRVVHLRKEAVVFDGPLIFVMLVLESHVELDPTYT
jgi:hypothetical protein